METTTSPTIMVQSEPTTVFVALGSNLGERFTYLKEAVAGLDRLAGTAVSRCSPVYETEAHTLHPGEIQPAFLNAVVALDTRMNPLELLEHSQELELRMGRHRRPGTRWEPRTLDVDLLYFGPAPFHAANLHVPHPGLAGRRFVLAPFHDLAPDLWIPSPFDKTVHQLLLACPDTSEVKKTAFILF